MKLRLLKKDWDKASKLLKNVDFSATQDCLVACCIKRQLPDAKLGMVGYCMTNIDGKLWYIPRNVEEIISDFIHQRIEARAKLPLTFELLER